MTNNNVERNDVLENMSGSATPENTETPTDQDGSHDGAKNPAAVPDPTSGDATEFMKLMDAMLEPY